MVAHQRLNEVADLVRAFAAAEAAAARAALAEPDDDRYLALRAEAADYLTPGLGLAVDRYAVPGGRTDLWSPEGARHIHPRTLFAVAAGASEGRPAWAAYVSGLRDPDGDDIDHELTIADVDGGRRIVGRRAVDPFADALVWEDAGGVRLPFDGPAWDVLIERLPGSEPHAAFLQDLAGR